MTTPESPFAMRLPSTMEQDLHVHPTYDISYLVLGDQNVGLLHYGLNARLCFLVRVYQQFRRICCSVYDFIARD
jgi:hypothetical protein